MKPILKRVKTKNFADAYQFLFSSMEMKSKKQNTHKNSISENNLFKPIVNKWPMNFLLKVRSISGIRCNNIPYMSRRHSQLNTYKSDDEILTKYPHRILSVSPSFKMTLNDIKDNLCILNANKFLLKSIHEHIESKRKDIYCINFKKPNSALNKDKKIVIKNINKKDMHKRISSAKLQ